MAKRCRIERGNTLAGNVVCHRTAGYARLSRMAAAPWAVLDEDGRGAGAIAANGGLLLQRREAGAAADPACMQGFGSQQRRVRPCLPWRATLASGQGGFPVMREPRPAELVLGSVQLGVP